MGSGNWVVHNLNSALNTWNGKIEEIWNLLHKPGGLQGRRRLACLILDISDAGKAIGYALLVLFFVMGVVKTCRTEEAGSGL